MDSWHQREGARRAFKLARASVEPARTPAGMAPPHAPTDVDLGIVLSTWSR